MIRKALKQTIPKLFSKPQTSYQLTESYERQNLHKSLKEEDPEIYKLVQEDSDRQRESINMIASENTPSVAVMESVGSIMNSKYSEGYPGNRYYGGTKHIDQLELLCQDRVLELFKLKKNEWGANVQPLSCNGANFAVITALLQPHDRVMSLKASHFGNMNTGSGTGENPTSALAKFFTVVPYFSTKEGHIDYDRLQKQANVYRPKVITVECNAYSRQVNWKLLRDIAKSVNANLLVDMTQSANLYAFDILEAPFEYADIITSSTQGSLRANRGAFILYRIGDRKDGKQGQYNYKTLIDQTLFPGLQGGPHNHSITGIVCALKEANTDYFKQYSEQTVKNNKVFYKELLKNDFHILSEGSDNNLFVTDLRNKKINGYELQVVLDRARMYGNKTMLIHDKNFWEATGLRISSSCMTSRGCMEADFLEIAKLFQEGVKITQGIVRQYGYDFTPEQFKEFITDKWEDFPKVIDLRQKVRSFASQFPLENNY